VLISLLLALAVTLAPLSVATTGQSEGQSPGRDHANPPAVAGEFLVAASPESAAAAGLTVVGKAEFGWTLVKQSSLTGAPAAEAAVQMAAMTDFEVEPNYLYEIADEPKFDDQWSLENTGQTGGKVDADIDILRAWKVTTGSPGVTIAVLDTGVAFSHPDLSSRIWRNSGEVPDNNADDDGNGYVDDVRGWDAVDNDADPADTHGHGTFVSTIAVAPRNGVGMAGVAPDSVIMPVRVCGSSGGCAHSAILTGMAYAIDNGADVINLSFGGYGKSTAMEAAIRKATAAGIVVVAAAGNDGINNDIKPFYPASYDVGGLISVAASNHNDALASFSNYGAKSVDLVAPGQKVLGGTLSNSWGTSSGTSFAAPKVAGVVALIKAAKPALDPVQVANVLSGSADVLSNLSGKVASGGRLNAGSAVAKPADPIPTDPIIEPDKPIAPDPDNDEGKFSDIDNSVFENAIEKLAAAGITQGCNPPINDKFCPGDFVTRGEMAVFLARAFKYTDDGGEDFFVDDGEKFYENAANKIRFEGVTQGCNPPANDEYCGDELVTREQMAAFLVRALGLTDDGGGDVFVDDDGSIFEGAIDRLGTAGITQGCNPPENDKFCPKDFVTRGQMAAFLVRAGLTE
jgi:subtilisin family serine protease